MSERLSGEELRRAEERARIEARRVLEVEIATLRTRAEQAEHELADRPKATIIPDAMRDAQEQIDALRAEAGRLREAAQILLDGIFEVPVPRSDAFYQAVRVTDIEKMTEALSSTPLAAVERWKAMERVVEAGRRMRRERGKDGITIAYTMAEREMFDALAALDRTEEK